MKMAIFGLARSGLSALKFLASKTDHTCFAVNRGAPEDWDARDEVAAYIPRENCYDEDDAQDLFAEMDVIIKSPGIPYTHPALQKAQVKRVEIISEIELAFRHSDIPVVAITGTNGKTTTATMTRDLLERLGEKVFLGGNIGIPYCQILLEDAAYDWAVIEVSSFQLENIKSFKPRVAILTNLSRSHGERYDSHELYRDAKLKLFQNMDDAGLALVPPSLYELNLPCPKDEIKAIQNMDFTGSQIIGEHNKENLFCAYRAALEICEDKRRVNLATQAFIRDYKGVSFRMEYIREVDGLKIYNDGKSTNMASTIAAIDSLETSEIHLVLGGKLRDREMDFSSLLTKNIKKIHAFGEASEFVHENLGEVFEVERHENLEGVFSSVKATRPKGALLFSPAFPSFDLYKNYEERARAFNSLAKSL